MAKFIIIIIILLIPMPEAHAELSRKEIRKREKIINAISSNIVSIYDIPLNTYVRLEMWDYIGRIFKANAGDMLRHPLPGKHHSRPYIIGREAWVFDNSCPSGDIYIMKPDHPGLLRRVEHKAYTEYEGSIRTVFGHHLISGGGDKDVDTAVIWNTAEDTVRTLSLKEGHYITSIAAAANMLHIGSCGGKINVYRFDTLDLSNIYSTNAEENQSWDAFNRRECISAISLAGEELIGVGEKTVFVWASGRKVPVRTYPKVLHNSAVFFYRQFMIEYGQDVLAVTDPNTRKIRHLNVGKTIEDAAVTSETVLKNRHGDILMLSLRDNGLWFYDFNTFDLIGKTDLAGHKLAAAGGCIFASDDHFFYRYYLTDREPEKFGIFLKSFRMEDIVVNEENYYHLLKLAYSYPDVIDPSVLARRFLNLYHLNVTHSFRYGKIGERSFEDNGRTFREEVFGYKLIYDIVNYSDKCYRINLDISRSGYYGQQNTDDEKDSKAISKQSVVVGAYRTYSGSIAAGEKEPLKVLIYPTEIRKLDKDDCK